MNAPEIALFGEWNTRNLGDRAIHAGVLGFFEECGWRTQSYAFGSLTRVDADPNIPEPPAARPRAGKSDQGHGIKAVLPPRAARALRAARQQYRALRLMPALRQAQAICVGGGALLSGPDMHFPQSLAALRRAADTLGKPILCLGCSADGAWSTPARRALEDFVSSCAMLSVRDQASARRVAEFAHGSPVTVFGDFCLAEADLRDDARAGGARYGTLAVNVSASPWPAGSWQRDYEEVLVALARYWQRTTPGDGAIRVFTTGTMDDVEPARRVALRLAPQGARLVLPASVEELNAMLRECEVVLASRLHAAVLALAQGAAVIGLSHSAKLQEFLGSLGLGHYGGGVATAARAAQLLGAGHFDALRREQCATALRSPLWSTRRALGRVLASAARASEPDTLLRMADASRALS